MIPLLFAASLVVCAVAGLPMLYAVLAGLGMFSAQGLRRGIPAARLLRAMIAGFRKSLIVVVVLLLIGAMSAAWRSSGLMALLVVRGVSMVYPPLFLLFAFLLCSGFSFIIGSSLGTVSVMGILMYTIGGAAGVPPPFTAGAILSGAYFGDRASFLSSSALLVSTLARADHRAHLRAMQRTSIAPFAVTALMYALMSRISPFDARLAGEVLSLERFFILDHFALWIPLVIVLLPAVTPLKMRESIALSTAAAFAVAMFIQNATPSLALHDLVFGFRRGIDHPQLKLLYGGGLVSMLTPVAIVFFSGALPPLLGELGTLVPYQRLLERLARRTFPFAAAFASGILTSLIGCSQTLAVFLQAPLLDRVYPEAEAPCKARDIGSTAILISALVPWNIAMYTPLAILGASAGAGLFAFYLFVLPIGMLVRECFRRGNLPGTALD